MGLEAALSGLENACKTFAEASTAHAPTPDSTKVQSAVKNLLGACKTAEDWKSAKNQLITRVQKLSSKEGYVNLLKAIATECNENKYTNLNKDVPGKMFVKNFYDQLATSQWVASQALERSRPIRSETLSAGAAAAAAAHREGSTVVPTTPSSRKLQISSDVAAMAQKLRSYNTQAMETAQFNPMGELRKFLEKKHQEHRELRVQEAVQVMIKTGIGENDAKTWIKGDGARTFQKVDKEIETGVQKRLEAANRNAKRSTNELPSNEEVDLAYFMESTLASRRLEAVVEEELYDALIEDNKEYLASLSPAMADSFRKESEAFEAKIDKIKETIDKEAQQKALQVNQPVASLITFPAQLLSRAIKEKVVTPIEVLGLMMFPPNTSSFPSLVYYRNFVPHKHYNEQYKSSQFATSTFYSLYYFNKLSQPSEKAKIERFFGSEEMENFYRDLVVESEKAETQKFYRYVLVNEPWSIRSDSQKEARRV